MEVNFSLRIAVVSMWNYFRFLHGLQLPPLVHDFSPNLLHFFNSHKWAEKRQRYGLTYSLTYSFKAGYKSFKVSVSILQSIRNVFLLFCQNDSFKDVIDSKALFAPRRQQVNFFDKIKFMSLRVNWYVPFSFVKAKSYQQWNWSVIWLFCANL